MKPTKHTKGEGMNSSSPRLFANAKYAYCRIY